MRLDLLVNGYVRLAELEGADRDGDFLGCLGLGEVEQMTQHHHAPLSLGK